MIYSELRQDLVSGDWILIASGRLRYQSHGRFLAREGKRERTLLKDCPADFEQPFEQSGSRIILSYANHSPIRLFRKAADEKNKDWRLVVLENKNPFVLHKEETVRIEKRGLYSVMEGVGHSDLIITRDHNKNFPKLHPREAFHVLEAMRDRYLMLLDEKNTAYVSIFQNWGPGAGASIYHPHYQILTIPVVPPDISHSLNGSANYFKLHKTCVHCAMIQWEKKQKKRVVFENEHAIAFAPFVSRNPFEIRIFPKRHRPYFENTFDEELRGVSEALQMVLRLIDQKLHDPDYNFFIHTAPVKDKNKHSHYHWHVEVYPKLSRRGGFQFGTGIEINIFDPDLVAKILKK